MKHSLPGAHRAAAAHIRNAAIHQKAISRTSLPELKAGSDCTVTALAGFYKRALESEQVLADLYHDVSAATAFLAGAAADVVGEFSELAQTAAKAEQPAKEAALSALTNVRDALLKTLAEVRPVLHEMKSDAQAVLTKAVAVDRLHLQSLHQSKGWGLVMLRGTAVEKHLPPSFTANRTGFTAEGREKLAGFVLKDLHRQLEDKALLADEYVEADRRAVKRAQEDRARKALAAIGRTE